MRRGDRARLGRPDSHSSSRPSATPVQPATVAWLVSGKSGTICSSTAVADGTAPQHCRYAATGARGLPTVRAHARGRIPLQDTATETTEGWRLGHPGPSRAVSVFNLERTGPPLPQRLRIGSARSGQDGRPGRVVGRRRRQMSLGQVFPSSSSTATAPAIEIAAALAMPTQLDGHLPGQPSCRHARDRLRRAALRLRLSSLRPGDRRCSGLPEQFSRETTTLAAPVPTGVWLR